MGRTVTATVTVLDGLVFARTVFDSSMNYRCAVVHGVPVVVPDEEKEEALRVLSEHLMPGRWDEVRRPTKRELAATLVLRLPLHRDSRGWFKEGWQREKMLALGLPDFGPVQQNVSFNERSGVTRGIHAEPWDKLVSLATGRAFGAWVDLREGPGFGTVVTVELDPSVAVFVPRGVGNSYQALEDGTAYSYLVNDHWSAAHQYVALDLADPDIAIPWPMPLAEENVAGSRSAAVTSAWRDSTHRSRSATWCTGASSRSHRYVGYGSSCSAGDHGS